MTFPTSQLENSRRTSRLTAHVGPSPLRLADLRGQIVVLAFYVLDFTGT